MSHHKMGCSSGLEKPVALPKYRGNICDFVENEDGDNTVYASVRQRQRLGYIRRNKRNTRICDELLGHYEAVLSPSARARLFFRHAEAE